MKINEKFWSVASVLFWIFYVTFLVSSIPHLAAWFRHLDGVQPLGLADGLYWLLAYGKSVAIDGADVLLTLAFLRKVSESEKSGWDYGKMVLICVFIIGFTGFSWYINWQYETQFMTADFLKADAMTGLFGNVGTSNPAVGSALQLFALVFTFISDTIMKQPGEIKPQKSLEMLRNEAAEAAERAALERQITEAQRSTKIGLIQMAKMTVLGSEASTPQGEIVSQEFTSDVQLEDMEVSQPVDKEVVFPPDEDETDDDIDLSTDTPLIDDITAYLLRQEKDTGNVTNLSTDRDTEPQAKVTRQLSTKASTKQPVAKGRDTARTKALRILKKHPGIGPTELAQKAQITRQYASKIIAETA